MEISTFSALNEYLPLKQGLRLFLQPLLTIRLALNEYLPLKQGLRLHRRH